MTSWPNTLRQSRHNPHAMLQQFRKLLEFFMLDTRSSSRRKLCYRSNIMMIRCRTRRVMLGISAQEAVGNRMNKQMKMLATRLVITTLCGMGSLPAVAVAEADRIKNQQPKAYWYRTYEQGAPALSSTITERHIRNGYEALDRNMQVIRRVPPYVAAQYEQQKAQRERLDAQRQADRNLIAVHISSVHAAAKRDSMLNEMQTRQQFLQAQLNSLQQDLARDIAAAAGYERRQQSIPEPVRQRLELKREQVAQAENNVQAIEKRQLEVIGEYKSVIERLTYIENNRSVLHAPARTTFR